MASGARSEKALGGDVGHRREAGDGESMRGSWGERTSAGDAPVRLGRRWRSSQLTRQDPCVGKSEVVTRLEGHCSDDICSLQNQVSVVRTTWITPECQDPPCLLLLLFGKPRHPGQHEGDEQREEDRLDRKTTGETKRRIPRHPRRCHHVTVKVWLIHFHYLALYYHGKLRISEFHDYLCMIIGTWLI